MKNTTWSVWLGLVSFSCFRFIDSLPRSVDWPVKSICIVSDDLEYRFYHTEKFGRKGNRGNILREHNEPQIPSLRYYSKQLAKRHGSSFPIHISGYHRYTHRSFRWWACSSISGCSEDFHNAQVWTMDQIHCGILNMTRWASILWTDGSYRDLDAPIHQYDGNTEPSVPPIHTLHINTSARLQLSHQTHSHSYPIQYPCRFCLLGGIFPKGQCYYHIRQVQSSLSNERKRRKYWTTYF